MGPSRRGGLVARVFISYASQDTEAARTLSTYLRDSLGTQHDVFLARDRIPAGEDWAQRLSEELRDTDALVCLVTPSFTQSLWCAAEIAVARTLGKRIIPLAAGADSTKIPMLERVQFIDYAVDIPSARQELVGQLQAFVDAGGVAPPPGAWQSPFPGLAPFDRDRAWAFCGRREETTELAEVVRSPVTAADEELVVVVGPPECGKSSLVRAGLLPMLLGEPGRWALPPVVPGRRPLQALAGAFAEAGVQRGLPWIPGEVARRLALAAPATGETEPGTAGGGNFPDLQKLVAEILAAAPDGHRRRLLIVLDQFEGVLTQTTPEDREQFGRLLQALIACGVRIVATLRSEFVPAIQESTRLRDVPLNLFTLRPISPDTLREIIVEPARRAKIKLGPSLVDVLVRDTPDGNALPLLAYTLGQLADGVEAGGTLSEQRYDAIGGVAGALADLADGALAARGHQGRPPDEVLASLLQLVAFDRDGRPVGKYLDGGGLAEEVTADLDAFVDKHLLTTRTESGRAKVFAVRHQHFLTAWPQLHEKIEQEREVLRDREALTDAAREWDEAGRPPDRLWDAGRIAQATRPGPSGTSRPLSEGERQFVAASGQRRKIRRRRFIAALATALVVVLALAALAGWQWTVARDEKSAAQDEKKDAIKRELLALAGNLLESDPRLATQVALAANDISGDDDTRAGLHDILVGTGYLGSLGFPEYEGAQRAVAFSPDGATVAFGGDGGGVVLADPPQPGKAGRIRKVLEKAHAGPVNAVAFAPDGRMLATAGDDGKIVFWDLTDPGQPRIRHNLGDGAAAVNAAAFSPDGRMLATADDDGRVILWTSNPDGSITSTPLGGHTGPVNAVAFAPDGRTLATAGADQKIIIWDVPGPGQAHARRTLGNDQLNKITAVAFRPDGGALTAADADGTLVVWGTAPGGQPGQFGEPPAVLPRAGTEYDSPITRLIYTSDGKLVTASRKQAVLVRDAADPTMLLGTPISDRGSPALGVAAAPDGKTLAVASQNGAVLLWSLAPRGQPHLLGGPITHTPVTDMTYIADGSTLYAAGGDNSLRIWDVTDPSHPRKLGPRIDLRGFGAVLETSHAGKECPDSVPRTQNPTAGCRLAISGSAGRVKIFSIIDPRNPELLADFPAHPGIPVNDMQFSDDGRLLATGAEDGQVYLWDVADPRGKPRQLGPALTGHTGAVRDVEFDEANAERDILGTASDDGTARLWDVTDREHPRLLGVLDDPRGPVNDVTFTHDGKTLFAASDDGNVWGWDISDPDNPTPLDRPLAGHRGPVYDQSDVGDHILATAGEDRKIIFWDVSDAHHPRRLRPVITHTAPVVDTNVARGKNRMAAASADNTIRLWDVSPLLDGVPGNVVELACARAGSGLDEAAWKTYIPDLPYRQTCPN